MKKTILVSSLFVATALVSQSALAEIKIRAGGGSSTYELGGDYIDAKSTYNPATVGLTISSDTGTNAGYLDISYSSGSGKHDGWTYIGNPSEEFKRTDWALIGGVVFLNQNNGIAGNVYGGVKSGTTTLGANKANLIASPLTTYTATTAWNNETFTSTGIVVGGGASFPIAGGRAGAVGVNVGVGIMGATWKDDSASQFNKKSDTAVGGSLGVSYTFPITTWMGVAADYKYHSYNYKFDFGTTAVPDVRAIREKIHTLGATLYAKF